MTLGLDVVYLDADFGLAQVAPDQVGGLPFTGIWAIKEMAILAGVLILTGGAFLLRRPVPQAGDRGAAVGPISESIT